MRKSSLMGHVCWAAIAAAAFGLGSAREKGAAGGEGASGSVRDSRSTKSVERGAGGAGSGGTAGRSVRAADGSTSGPRGESGGANPADLSVAQLEAIALDAFRSGSPIDRRMAFGKLLESLTAENAETILGFLKENKADKEQWRDFHYAWGMIDGEAALKHSIESPDYDMAYTMSGWASTNPDAARAFLNNLPADLKTDRELLKRSLVAGMADRDPQAATDFVYSLAAQGESQAGELLSSVTEEVLRSMGAEDAALWSQGLPDGDLKGVAMDRVAHSYVDRDPEAAARWAQQFAGESYAARVIEEVGDEWAERNPVAAVDWLESLPGGSGQTMGLSSAYGEWTRRDPVAAGERIAGMPRSPQRDAAISGYSRSLAYRDPSAAIEWANSISQDGLRNNALTQAGQALFRRDANAAREWVVSSGLPPEAQKAVLNPPQRR